MRTDYRAFHRFGQAKIHNDGSILGSSQFLLLPKLPHKMTLASKVVKIDSKIVILLCLSKSATHSVEHKSESRDRKKGTKCISPTIGKLIVININHILGRFVILIGGSNY